eukprot:PITA_24395
MAASTSTAADSNNNTCYDVFISHRGPDVKKTFASHLYRRLISHGLRVFLDYKELQEGEDFPCQIKGAISAASVHVAIFSPTYADSEWCLVELVLMLKSGTPIIPVFHRVEPTELRRIHGYGVYATSLRNLENKTNPDNQPRYDSETIGNWRNALSRVADISGLDLAAFNGDEGALVDKIVEVVVRKGVKTPLNVARYPTGLEEKVQDFETEVLFQQRSGTVQAVGITGLGGVGKTTLAIELFNRKSSEYSKSYFLSDVRENAKKSLHSLQSQLLKGLFQLELHIDNRHAGIEELKKRLSSCKVLLVLDDVDHQDQVFALLPQLNDLHHDSLILITSRDKDVVRRSGVQESSIYLLSGLNTERSRELFCSHAFCNPHPLPGFESLVNNFLTACNGLPLSLKVFGGLLCGNTDKSYWKDELEELRKTLPDDIQKSLQISYDALKREEQEIFLDIACFFIGEDKDTAIRVWDGSGWNGKRGFQSLVNKCLVEVYMKDTSAKGEKKMQHLIRMHDHLRDMGRDLANRSGFPCRLWCGTKQMEGLLEQSSEATRVRGIRMFAREHYDERSDTDEDDKRASFSRYKMKNLQILDIHEGDDDLLKCLLEGVDSPNLLYLRWRNCRCSSLPPYIPMKKLRVLDVEGPKLETLWKEDLQVPLQLRELRIRKYWLFQIPESIGQLKHLEYIDLSKCDALERLPDSFGNLSRLKDINLYLCRSLERLPDTFGNLSRLKDINLDFCISLKRLPDSFGELSMLERIGLS